jgi:hypothetical protein
MRNLHCATLSAIYNRDTDVTTQTLRDTEGVKCWEIWTLYKCISYDKSLNEGKFFSFCIPRSNRSLLYGTALHFRALFTFPFPLALPPVQYPGHLSSLSSARVNHLCIPKMGDVDNFRTTSSQFVLDFPTSLMHYTHTKVSFLIWI